jgi:hypothetical protein
MKQQLLVINAHPIYQHLIDFCLASGALFLSPHHIFRAVVIINPSILLRLHEALKKRKYRLLFSARKKGKPGPKGPSQELIQSIIEMKRRNPRYSCPMIAEQISKVYGILH